VDGQLLIDNSEWSETGETFYSFGSVAVRASLSMIAGQKYRVKLEAWTKLIGKEGTKDDDPVHVFGVQPSVRLGFMEETKSEEELISDAVEAAKEADIVICVLGLNDEWESEGYDRKSMGLPGAQDELVWRLLKECGNREKVIVVNQSGSPVHMPWAEEVSTIVQAWYGGQEAGNALWDVLTGGVNPNGRLPVSWPKEYHDLGFKKHNWPGVNGIVKYEEGINVGYHLFQNKGLEPRWWFGHGLSYTAF
jgi:beta-glucosidase